MKKIFLFGAGILFMLMAACSKDNSCVTQIVEIVNEGAAQRQALRDSTVTFEELGDNIFTTPRGNIFGYSKIFEIIESNPDYKLTVEDKRMLKEAVKKFRSGDEPQKDDMEEMDDYLVSKNAEITIETSETLKDLFGHGSAL